MHETDFLTWCLFTLNSIYHVIHKYTRLSVFFCLLCWTDYKGMKMSCAASLSLFLSAAVSCVVAYKTGAPSSRCSSMTPNHLNPAQQGPSPYTIELSSKTFCPNRPVTVTIQGTDNFKGFLCQPRKIVGTYETSGQLASADTWSVKNNCDKAALTHGNNDVKDTLQMTWTPDATNTDPVYIVCTIVKEKVTFWVQQKSEAITYAGSDVCDDHGQSNPCSYGSPLSEPANCGRGGERCPENHYCEIAPNDVYAVCCQKACSTDADCTMVTNSSCMSGKCQVDRVIITCSSDLDCLGMTAATCIAGQCTISGAKESAALSLTLILGATLLVRQLLSL